MANSGMQRGAYGRAESPYNAEWLPSAFGSDTADQDFSSIAAIGRVRRDFGRSFISMLFTTRESEGGAHNRVATYTNLAPGRYVLRAKAGTRNGLWSERETTLAIQILPPWWRTIW